MEYYITGLILGLAIILISCELFTNGLEWLGKVLKLGDGVIGSILSAVGTCLPETMIPVIAILFSNKDNESVDVGIGAILGAPFMLSTLAFFVTGLSVLLFRKRRKTGLRLNVKAHILSRDIKFFLIVYPIGIAAAFFQSEYIKNIISLMLILFYIFYITITVRQDTRTEAKISRLYLDQYLNMPTNIFFIMAQIIMALCGIIFGAELFVKNIEGTSHLFKISPLVLSLILTPIATELPEKFNSIIWIARNRDTLALGNITGAMVFQSCIPVAIGIAATSWKLNHIVLFSAAIALASGFVVCFYIKMRKKLTPFPLIFGGAFYIIFLLFIMRNII